MVDYYSILNLTIHKKRREITNELVKEHYEEAIKRCEEQGIKFFKTKENLDDYKEILNDAYMALANENARKHYDELMNMLEKEEQAKKLRKQQKSGEKTIGLGKGKISSLKEAMQNMSKSPDTKEILKQIKEKAQKEHPIPKPEELEER